MQFRSESILASFDPNNEHDLHTDTSSIVLSGILLQAEGTELHPVFYYSRSCTDAENPYASHELEVLAIVEDMIDWIYQLQITYDKLKHISRYTEILEILCLW